MNTRSVPKLSMSNIHSCELIYQGNTKFKLKNYEQPTEDLSNSAIQEPSNPTTKVYQKCETKNIVKNFGNRLRKFIKYNSSQKERRLVPLRNFLSKTRGNYKRKDFQNLYKSDIGKYYAKNYLSEFHVIQDIVSSQKIEDIRTQFKYINTFYASIENQSLLETLIQH